MTSELSNPEPDPRYIRAYELADRLFPDHGDYGDEEWEYMMAYAAICDVLTGSKAAPEVVSTLSLDQIEDYATAYGIRRALEFRRELDASALSAEAVHQNAVRVSKEAALDRQLRGIVWPALSC